MLCGIKLWSKNRDLFEKAKRAILEHDADYVEILLFSEDEAELSKLSEAGIPLIIHSGHFSQGLCLSDNNETSNIRTLENTTRIAGRLGAKFIIIHPDFGDIHNLINVLKQVDCSKILVENMPKYHTEGVDFIGYSPQEILQIMNETGCGFCLDFEKAYKAAWAQGKNAKQYIIEFLKLKPTVFHISDCQKKVKTDQHLNLGEGNIDLAFIKNQIVDCGGYVTFEVPLQNGITNSIMNIRYFKKI